jgi:predicted MFS family arabinose efflux permease
MDQRPAGRGLAGLYFLEGLIFLALAWLAKHFALAPVLLLALIDGLLGLTARVIARATSTRISSGPKLLREANALMNGSFSVCFLAGPALGGLIVGLYGTVAALLINVGAFAVMALTVATAKHMPRTIPDVVTPLGRLRAALAEAWTQPLIRRLLTLETAAIVFFTISIPVEVVFAQHTLRAGAAGYGLLLSAWGAGAIVGSAFYARWRAMTSRVLITMGTCSLGAGFLVMAIAPSLAVAIGGAAVAGLGNGIQAVAVRTALQEATPVRWTALILSLNESIFQAVPGVGFVIGGTIAALVGPRAALAVGAAGSLSIALAMWSKLAPSDDLAVYDAVQVEARDSDQALTAAGRRS